MANVLVPFTTGVEEVEMIAVVDVLRRANVVVLPGGLRNAHLLRDDANVKAVVQRLRYERKSIAAICAAPTALAAYGITAGRKVTSYPSCLVPTFLRGNA